jgi:hypothetical protein
MSAIEWRALYLHDDTPHLVNSKLADTSASGCLGGRLKGVLEAGGNDQSNDGSCELTNTLHGEDGVHHGSSPLGGSELRSDDRGQWVVTTNSDTLDVISKVAHYFGVQSAYHKHTPEDDETSDGNSAGWGRESLSESSEDDDDQLKTVHLLSSNNIGEITETELTKNSSARGSDLDSSIGVGGDRSFGLAIVEENNTQHSSDQVNGEDLYSIVRIKVSTRSLMATKID